MVEAAAEAAVAEVVVATASELGVGGLSLIYPPILPAVLAAGNGGGSYSRSWRPRSTGTQCLYMLPWVQEA